MQKLIVGSRDSALALAQTSSVCDKLKSQYQGLQIQLKTYKTKGDLNLENPLSELGDKGLFVKELEVALLNNEIDFAVHSMKDMPSAQPPGLVLFSFGPREVPYDALVSQGNVAFRDLPEGAIIGTSSLRRQVLLKRIRPDIQTQVIRGNVQTRLRKLSEGPYDAIVLAAAGLNRLNLEDVITETFSPEDMIPACCQGILGVETRADFDPDFWASFTHTPTHIACQAERAFLGTLQGGCNTPMGAYASGEQLIGFLASVDGQDFKSVTEPLDENHPALSGEKLARQLL